MSGAATSRSPSCPTTTSSTSAEADLTPNNNTAAIQIILARPFYLPLVMR